MESDLNRLVPIGACLIVGALIGAVRATRDFHNYNQAKDAEAANTLLPGQADRFERAGWKKILATAGLGLAIGIGIDAVIHLSK